MKKKIKYIITFVAGFVITNNVLAASFYNENEGTMNICGLDNMSPRIPAFTSGLYNVIKILVPVILVIMGMIDFTKAVMASDEEKMKKSQKTFITRAIAAVIIFFVMTVVQFIFKEVDKNNANGFTDCMNCILSNKSCGQVKKEEKKTCEQYTGNCPETDEYGHSCSKDYNSGNKCKTKGTACSDFRKKECNGAKTTSGVSCEYVGISCRSVCSGLSIGSCYNESHCEWTGGDPNNGHCQNKTVKNSNSTGEENNSNNTNNSNITGQQIVDYAMKYVGQSYVYGGTWNGEDPYTPTDCSGFTKGVFGHFGIELPRTANSQGTMSLGREVPIDMDSLQAGDLLFFHNGTKFYHVVIYAGNGKVVHASSTKTGVKIGNYYTTDLTKAIRLLG